MSAAPGDFEEFVAARWRELDAVATVTTGDAAVGARVTASALAGVGRRWAETTELGSPTGAARVAVLRAALGAAAPSPSAPPPSASVDEGEPADDEARTRAALTGVLAGAPLLARAALAAREWWDEGPELVASVGSTDAVEVRERLDDLDRGLATAHAAALGRDEVEAAWALPAAVTDTLEHLADAVPVTDPVALVDAERTRGARRHRARLPVVAAALAVTVAAVTALAWPSGGPDVPTGPAPDDPSWSSVDTWAPRGRLVDDPTVASIATDARRADPTARLLYAGPVGDTLALVMTGSSPGSPTLPAGVPGPALGEGFDGDRSFLRLWTSPARIGPAALAPTSIGGEPTSLTGSLVALSVEQDTAGTPPTVLVLTQPTVRDGSVITGARPQPDGTVLPVVVDLPLVDGVGTFAPIGVGFTPEVALAGYRGPPAGGLTNSFLLPPTGPAEQLAAAQRILLAGVTGNRPDSLETTSVLEAAVPASAVDPDYVGTYPDFVGTRPRPLRVTVVTTTSREGGRVRTSRLAGATTQAPWTYLERLVAVPTTDPHALLVLPTSNHPGFVAIAPDGATAQLVTEGGRVRDSARISQGLATLSSAEDPIGTTFRLRVLAPDGHVVYDAVPPASVELVDSGAVTD